ncbi:MAG: IPExxxVDY family protein [Crocinitomicaceae bacterium]|jgi:hypothetical protein|nr:IPExxxVDY family protein [Crocinitomicaceae bacterium]
MTKKKIKHTIVLETDYDYDMIGICSHHNDYRIVWGLNELLDIHLEKADDFFVVSSPKGKISEHPFYEFDDEENYMTFFFLKNKHDAKFLIPEQKQIDYFLFILNNNLHSVSTIIQRLKTLPTVLAAYEFDPTEFTSTEHIIFE